jgi:hypothetical protein
LTETRRHTQPRYSRRQQYQECRANDSHNFSVPLVSLSDY